MRNGLYRFERAILGAIDNFPVAPVRWMLRFLVFPLGASYKPAPDRLGHEVVRMAIEPGAVRDRLTRYIYVSKKESDPTGLLEVALEKVVAADAAERKLERAVRDGVVRRYHGYDWIGDAERKSVVTPAEAAQLREVEALTARAIAVDHFDPAEVKPHYVNVGHNSRSNPDLAAE
ncbi:MAG: acyl-CoA dehydrogenase domain-containing protein, partial [Hyphomicrobiaceae bacterium]